MIAEKSNLYLKFLSKRIVRRTIKKYYGYKNPYLIKVYSLQGRIGGFL